MSQVTDSIGDRFSWFRRTWTLFFSLVLITLLITAWNLEPDPSGVGTHKQLGFSTCTFIQMFGKPCPTCGMTTAWAWIVRGEFRQALQVNLGGTLLAILAMITSPWLVGSSVCGKWIWITPKQNVVFGSLLIIMVVIFIDWFFRVQAF